MNVIDLAAVRAARKASACTFRIFGDFRRPSPTDVVSVVVAGDFDIAVEMFRNIVEARSASTAEVQALPAELDIEDDGKAWAEGYVTYASALALRDLCQARGLIIEAA
ncbi:hypothetical protein [Devosia alba]|uniref:hypothetical protein n=1 Tax=Devosia alba TaxID=3152360 RepID=UPI003263CDEC